MHTIKITISVFLIISFIVAAVYKLKNVENTSERLEKHIDIVEKVPHRVTGIWLE
jgi:flagellar biogenesis protein FliO